jgi:hypothetical protein
MQQEDFSLIMTGSAINRAESIQNKPSMADSIIDQLEE